MIRFIKILIETNLFIAFAAVAFLWANIYLLDLHCGSFWILSLQIFFSTWFVYQISRWIYFKKGEYTNENELIVKWFEEHPMFNQITIYGSALLTFIFTLFLNWKTIIVLCVIGGISILYPVQVLKPLGITTRLRDFPFVKIFLIAFVWSATSVILPYTEAYPDSKVSVQTILLLFASQFIYILFITLPFDINDAEVDKKTNIKTIPAVLGINFSKILGFFLGLIYVISMLFIFMLFNWNHAPNKFLADATIITIIILVILLQLFTFFKSDKVDKWIIKLIYDGSMIFYFTILFIAKIVS